ncbi:hypothetical protein TrST_g3726 [Triparma strigata]|uniref:Uncharacterized protein n=1 Tax=Triparma strigata TaxID=1606541 RepID=A0A9W7C1X8_9STRA|nr:hypothetical protein TrST_g3726 [Triparma strigata]
MSAFTSANSPLSAASLVVGAGETNPSIGQPTTETKPPDEGRVRTGSRVEMAEGGIVMTMKLMPTTEIKLINLTGFNMSKMKLEEIAQLYLSGGLMTMEQF